MVAEIKIKNIQDPHLGLQILFEFQDRNGFDIYDYIFEREIDGGLNSLLYLIVEDKHVMSFVEILLENSIIVYHKKDFTKELIDIIINNELKHFKKGLCADYDFNRLIDKFYQDKIGIDQVLDKILKVGINCLSETDKVILEKIN